MTDSMESVYESETLLSQYLALHYGRPDDVLPFASGPHDALDYPKRCVTELLESARLPEKARGLDVGCAVGRSTFELATYCHEVIGIDLSRRFIDVARHMAEKGWVRGVLPVDGGRAKELEYRVPAAAQRGSVSFRVGDACNLDSSLGSFDVVLGLNLVDRLPDPRRFLDRLPELVRPGGQLILTTPFTWLEEFTPRTKWLGGSSGQESSEVLREVLDSTFSFQNASDLSFLIREHTRKYQWSMAWAGVWVRE